MIGYDEWLTADRLAIEDRHWQDSPSLRAAAEQVAAMLPSGGRILEIGCGTGWVPYHLKAIGLTRFDYTGVDASPLCLELARERNRGRRFIQARAESFAADLEDEFDVICAVAFFKHVRLADWSALLSKLLRNSKRSLFAQTLAESPREDADTPFIHAWQSIENLEFVLAAAGHRLVRPSRRELADMLETEPFIETEKI
jgi:SAM-dependent methyltransferase